MDEEEIAGIEKVEHIPSIEICTGDSGSGCRGLSDLALACRDPLEVREEIIDSINWCAVSRIFAMSLPIAGKLQ
jgi:hypothetical protein